MAPRRSAAPCDRTVHRPARPDADGNCRGTASIDPRAPGRVWDRAAKGGGLWRRHPGRSSRRRPSARLVIPHADLARAAEELSGSEVATVTIHLNVARDVMATSPTSGARDLRPSVRYPTHSALP